MGNVIVSLICIAIMLTGMMVMTQSSFSSVDVVSESWKQMEERAGEIARTKITPLTAETQGAGANVEIALRNEGEMKLADFARWDVIIHYYRATGDHLIKWLPYTEADPPGDNEWTVTGIFMDAATSDPEVFEPGIFNPGEEMVIQIKVSPPVGPATTNWASITTPNGITASIIFTG